MQTAFITKYALSSGIREVELAARQPLMETCTTVKWPGGLSGEAHFYGDDVHRTREAACAHAETMRTKRIASLKKQIAKLEKLSFDLKS